MTKNQLQWSRPQLRTETWRLWWPRRSRRVLLQWSRPQLRTETAQAGETQASKHLASMEPSSVEDGNGPNCIAPPHLPSRLQWSRPQLRTETSTGRFIMRGWASASMEPSSVEDGNLRGIVLPEPLNSGFNGAVLS